MTTLKQTPSQTVGPYFAYGLCPQQYDYDLKSLFTPTIATPDAEGEHVLLVGQVFDGDGNVVGVATRKVVGRGVEGLSFAVPIDRVCRLTAAC